jgi:cobalt-zinc-cadmium efflux system membrane fusion protein
MKPNHIEHPTSNIQQPMGLGRRWTLIRSRFVRANPAPKPPHSKRFALRFSLMLAVVVSLVFSLTGCSSKGDTNVQPSSITASNVTLTAAQRQSIKLYTVEPARFHRTLDADGIVDFDQEQATAVLAPFGGPVSKLLVSLGDKVAAQAPLAEVTSPDFATAISTYRKAIATAKIDRQLADQDQTLLQHHGVSLREASQAESDAVSAEADRDAALQSLVSLGVDPPTIKDIQDGKTVLRPEGLIRSPIAGTVVEKSITPGLLLDAGTTPCFTVADLSRVWVMTYLFGPDLSSVKVGDPAEVATGAGTNTLSGTVENISAEIDPNTRSVLARVVVNNTGEVLKKQMYVHVRINSRQETTGILVPVSAVLRDDENLPFVYLVQPDGSYARQHVTLANREGDQYEISEGLQAGNQIVVDGGIFVQFIQNQ